MVTPLTPGLFTQLFTSTAALGDMMTEALLEDIADAAVERARAMLIEHRTGILGPSTSPGGEPPAFRSGTLRASMGHTTASPGDYDTASVLIGPRRGFHTPYGTKREAYMYAGFLEHEQDHPFLKRAVREAASGYHASGFRFTQWMGKTGGHAWGMRT